MINRTAGICGVGAVTGYGWGVTPLWKGLMSGVSACTPTLGLRSDADDAGWVAHIGSGGRADDGPSRFARSMRAVVREAVDDAGRRGWIPGRRVGLVHATVLGEVDLWRSFYLEEKGRVGVRDYLGLMPSTPIFTAMRDHGFHGPAMGVSAMCASGNAALLTAKAWLDNDVVDDVIVVATDISCTPETVDHFVRLGVAVTDEEPLSACRPFQEGSRGFVMGEASVAFVLSPRLGQPYAWFLGGAMTHDAYHPTSIAPDLRAVAECFTAAFRAAGVKSHEIRYLNAHGPGTKQCDTAEATILEQMLSPAARVYSVKPLTGHCQAAASAVEIAVAVLGYYHGLIPAPRSMSTAHPQLLSGNQQVDNQLTAKSSLGMGGHNSVIVLAPS